jgi:transcription initiation factor IIE alpha subunit
MKKLICPNCLKETEFYLDLYKETVSPFGKAVEFTCIDYECSKCGEHLELLASSDELGGVDRNLKESYSTYLQVHTRYYEKKAFWDILTWIGLYLSIMQMLSIIF